MKKPFVINQGRDSVCIRLGYSMLIKNHRDEFGVYKAYLTKFVRKLNGHSHGKVLIVAETIIKEEANLTTHAVTLRATQNDFYKYIQPDKNKTEKNI